MVDTESQLESRVVVEIELALWRGLYAGCKSPPAYQEIRGEIMDQDYLARICDARDVLCGYCKSGDCFMCTVHHLVNDAFGEIGDVEVEYDEVAD